MEHIYVPRREKRIEFVGGLGKGRIEWEDLVGGGENAWRDNWNSEGSVG